MLELGSTFGPYRLEAVLGRGGMGMVYEATQLSLDRVIALKVVAPGLSADHAFRARFRREGPMQARIDHPHVVPVYEAGEHEGHLFIAMRLVRGANLKELIVARELDPRRTLAILRDVADALATAHESNVIHRDVKPSNILVGRRDHAFLCDFGLGKEPGSGSGSFTKTGHVVGTLDYIAPEQIRGQEASSASDVYAFAAVLYETLAGQVPYPRSTDAALLYAHVSEPPPRLSDLRPDLPAGLDGLIAQGLAKEPAERPASPLELVEEAERILAGTRAGVPALPEAPVPRETVADTPPVPDTPLPVNASTVADAAAPFAASTLTDVELAPAPAAASTETDVELAPAPAAASAETDAEVAPPAAPAIDRSRSRTATSPTLPTAVPDPRLAPRPEVSRRRRSAAAAGIAAIAAIAAGATLGGTGGDPLPAGSTELRAAAGTVAVPAGWRPAAAPEVPGLAFEDASSVADPEGRLVVGRLRDAGGRLLLPAAFVASLPGAPEDGDPVKLGDLEAYRHAELFPRGVGRPVRLFVTPTDAGVVAVACVSAAERFMAGCDRAAGTLELAGAKALPLGPDEAYGARVDAALSDPGGTRRRLEASLGSARTRRQQAAAAAGLAAEYATARRRLGPAPANPTVREAAREVSAALAAVSGAYEDVAGAARRGRKAAYRRGASAVRRADRRLDRALDALTPLGYRPGGGE